jgi:hypothetical protein
MYVFFLVCNFFHYVTKLLLLPRALARFEVKLAFPLFLSLHIFIYFFEGECI